MNTPAQGPPASAGVRFACKQARSQEPDMPFVSTSLPVRRAHINPPEPVQPPPPLPSPVPPGPPPIGDPVQPGSDVPMTDPPAPTLPQ